MIFSSVAQRYMRFRLKCATERFARSYCNVLDLLYTCVLCAIAWGILFSEGE